MGRITVGKTSIVVLVIYNLPRNRSDPEQAYNKNDERTMRMVNKAAEDSLLRAGKCLTLGRPII